MTDVGCGDGVHIGRTTDGFTTDPPTPDTDQAGGDGYIDTRNEYNAAEYRGRNIGDVRLNVFFLSI